MRRFLLSVVAFGLLGVVLWPVPRTLAANGLSVTPTIEQLTFEPGQPSQAFTATVTNDTAQTVTLSVSAEDFDSVSAAGTINFTKPGAAALHGLSNAVTATPSTRTLAAGASAAVNITVSNPAALAGGGHYTAVVYRLLDQTAGTTNTVSIQPGVATLVFASTTGQGTQRLQLHTPVLDRLLASWPATLPIVLANNGDTQTIPRGIVQLRDMHGAVVAQAQLNVDSGLILPASDRLFTVALPSPVRGWLPGLFDVRVQYRHDGQSSYITYTERVVYLPAGFIIACLGVGTLIVIVVLAGVRRRRQTRYMS